MGKLLLDNIYLCIDLKSFYASVECVERGLNPATTNLVVADQSRSEKTICLAVTPPLKAIGVPGRPRLFEVIQIINEVNKKRLNKIASKKFQGSSYNSIELEKNNNLEISFIAAVPRMALYIQYSTSIYDIYLKYISPEDIHIYSIDEVFIDITPYLNTYKITPYDFAKTIIKDIFNNTGITATAGIGTNLYLAKVAMDIMAKYTIPDKEGVRIAYLDEKLYRQKLWSHRPVTDFWRVGKGYAEKMAKYGIYTMGDIAKCSISNNNIYNEDLLYKLFGINAELLIDHAWGYEPCKMSHIKAYKPESKSISSGQVLHNPYTYDSALNVVKEMTDSLVLELVEKNFLTSQISITIGYDIENMSRTDYTYKGKIKIDSYGRIKPQNAHGSINLDSYTSSTKNLVNAAETLFDRISDKNLLVRKLTVTFNNIIKENTKIINNSLSIEDFIDDNKNIDTFNYEKEKNIQLAVINIKNKYGKNAIIKGMNMQDGATGMDRNNQIGGHKA